MSATTSATKMPNHIEVQCTVVEASRTDGEQGFSPGAAGPLIPCRRGEGPRQGLVIAITRLESARGAFQGQHGDQARPAAEGQHQ